MRRCAPVLVLLLAACDDPDANEPQPLPALPAAEFCDPARDAADDFVEREREMLELINARRADGADCGERGFIGPAPELRLAGGPWCAARVHALDMAERDYFAHEDPDGNLPWDRLRQTEYAFVLADEAIASGPLAPREVLEEIWMVRPGSCAALMAPQYEHVGIGYAARDEPADPQDDPSGDTDPSEFWTVVLSVPFPR